MVSIGWFTRLMFRALRAQRGRYRPTLTILPRPSYFDPPDIWYLTLTILHSLSYPYHPHFPTQSSELSEVGTEHEGQERHAYVHAILHLIKVLCAWVGIDIC